MNDILTSTLSYFEKMRQTLTVAFNFVSNGIYPLKKFKRT
ncbi:Hypothetical protein AJF4211_000040 [Avibacterium paragallinarum JF4211]|nr:Hypothetical protein AJF4211_000040 [Avibacterium paragallinarum JF4211]